MENTVQSFFSNSGPLSLAISNYHQRQSQLDMSLMIEEVFKKKEFACIEAATGIGKTFAYLIPALFKAIKDKQKIVISTHTIALQEQIYHKDLPFLLELLKLDIPVVLVKGMNQYFCIEKFQKAQSDPQNFKNPYFLEISDNLQKRSDPFFESLSSTLPKDLWYKVNADSLSCLAHACPNYKNCFFYDARKDVEGASILIVNHHLLLTDLMMKQEGQAQTILPECHHVIIDEAHHIPSIAEELFSHELVKNSLEIRLRPRILHEHLEILSKAFRSYHEDQAVFFCQTECLLKIDEILKSFAELYDFTQSHQSPDSQYLILDPLLPQLTPLFDDLIFDLKDLSSSCDHMIKLLKELELQDKFRVSAFVLDKLKTEISLITETLYAFSENKKDKLFYFEQSVYHQAFNCHYIEASKKLGHLLEKHYLSTTFASATLTFNQRFESFKNETGLLSTSKPIKEGIFHSDFNYKEAMLFAVPSDMPEPHEQEYENKLFELCKDVIEISKGGLFILFTSYDQLNKMAAKLASYIFKDPINLLVQGNDSKKNLIDSFKTNFHSVLLGTDSFWEGVDVQGDHLRCVIITKLPFKSPADPLFQATSQKLKKQGLDPFNQKALPDACIKFKQGLGRLIRSKNDKGVVICTDIRIIKKTYGKFFLQSLPNCNKLLAGQSQLKKSIKEFIHPQTFAKI